MEDTITFGTSGLDRAGHLRGDAAAQATLRAEAAARCVALWRGKPMLDGADALAWLPTDHALFGDWQAPHVFLGLDSGQPRFAMDLSHWVPAEGPQDLDSFKDQTTQHHPDVPEDHLFHELRAVMTGLTRRDAELAATARAILGWHQSHGFCANCGAPSEVSKAGWERHCPQCRRNHFPRTDPVVIMLITHGNSVLLGRSPHWPERMYSLLAGFVEPGETIEAAVRRETLEEAGVHVGPVKYLASQPWPYPSSLMFGCRGEALSTEIHLDPEEIEDALWMTREELLNVFAGTHPKVREPRRGAIARSLLHDWLSGGPAHESISAGWSSP